MKSSIALSTVGEGFCSQRAGGQGEIQFIIRHPQTVSEGVAKEEDSLPAAVFVPEHGVPGPAEFFVLIFTNGVKKGNSLGQLPESKPEFEQKKAEGAAEEENTEIDEKGFQTGHLKKPR